MAATPIELGRTPGHYARRYARLGWYVMPLWWAEPVLDTTTGEIARWRCACGNVACPSPAKHPIAKLAPQGQNSATTDEAKIASWWAQMPRANIGIVLAPSNLVAIDIDPRNGGEHTIAEVEARHGALRSDVLQLTGGGGEHRLFAVPAGQVVQVPGTLGPGVDVKHHGYIVAEPSIHVSGRTYQWEGSSDPLDGVLPSPLPDWLRSVRPEHLPQEPASRVLAAADVLELQSALFCIDADARETWLNVGMALHATGAGSQAYGIWCDWSKQSDKFDAVDQARVWRSFRDRGLEGLSVAWIFAQAQAAGWVNPRSREARSFATAPAPTEGELAAAAPAAPPSREVPAHLLTVPGVLGRAVDWIRATARKPQPLFDVQAALALGSVVLGRKFRTDNDNWTALYFLNVGASGSGKEHGKYALETLLEAAQLDHLIGGSRFASESGVLSALIERPAHLAVLDEFGKSLEESNAAQNYAARGTLKSLMEVWGRAHGTLRPVSYSTAGLSQTQIDTLAARVVRKPSLTAYAMTTPEPLFEGVTSKAAVDGFLNRFLVVFSDIGRQVARLVRPIEPPAVLLDWMRAQRARSVEGNLGGIEVAHDQDPVPVTLAIEDGAQRLFDAFAADCVARANALDEEGLGEMTARWPEMSMRLALIVAASLERATVTAEAARWAIDYIACHGERAIDQLRAHMADSPFHRLTKAVLRLIVAAGERGITSAELGRRCRPWSSATLRMQQDCIAALERDGYIRQGRRESLSGRGRPGAAYFLNTVDIVSTGGVDG